MLRRFPGNDVRGTTLGFIGLGAFGRFAARHLAPHFQTVFYDPEVRDLPAPLKYWVEPASIAEVAASDIVVLAMPVQHLSDVVRAITPLLRPGTLVLDVCSVKSEPLDILSGLPAHVDIVGTHPVFGPQSGKRGITGLPIALVPLRGHRTHIVKRFLRENLGLHVVVTTAEEHDRQMASVQGLTHLIAKVMLAMPQKDIWLKTATYEHLEAMLDMLRHDSDDLFRAICGHNPYVGDVVKGFFEAVEDVSDRLGVKVTGDSPLHSEGIRAIGQTLLR